MDTGDITPMISTPIVSRMLPPSIFRSPAAGGSGVWKGRDGEKGVMKLILKVCLGIHSGIEFGETSKVLFGS